MIELYSGTPGSGKSLHLAEKIYNRVRYTNTAIIGNFNLNLNNMKGKKRGKYYYWDNIEITPQKLIDFSMKYSEEKGRKAKEDEILLVIDECQIMFNSREWNMLNRGAWLSFFSQHRKLGYHVILVAQFDRMIDRQIRSLIEYEYKHRKITNFGLAGFVIRVFTFGDMFVSVKIWYPLNEKIGQEFFKAHKKYYSIYDSYVLFNSKRIVSGCIPKL